MNKPTSVKLESVNNMYVVTFKTDGVSHFFAFKYSEIAERFKDIVTNNNLLAYSTETAITHNKRVIEPNKRAIYVVVTPNAIECMNEVCNLLQDDFKIISSLVDSDGNIHYILIRDNSDIDEVK
jgi:hypothetical protein